MSTPPYLKLPCGVRRTEITTTRGSFAALDNEDAVTVADSTRYRLALLLPGFTGSKEDFLAILEPLALNGIRAIAIDLRGQYETAGPATAQYTLSEYAADTLAVITELDTVVDLVGHSFGGLVARETVLANPLAVSTLTLMDSGPAAVPPQQQSKMQLFAQVLQSAGAEAVWTAKGAMESAEGIVPPSDPEIREFLTQRFLANSPASLLAMVTILCECEDQSEELAAVAPPILVLFGETDDVWAPEEQRAMATTLSASVASLPDVGHSPAADAPAETAELLRRFWSTSQSP